MVATASRTKTRHSQVVDDLAHRKVSEYLYEVESRSITLGSHMVMLWRDGEWRCDLACPAYQNNRRCSHVATVLRAEREGAEVIPPMLPSLDACCGCFGPAGPMWGCNCGCHLDAPSLPTPDTSVDGTPFFSPDDLLVSVPKRKHNITLTDLFPQD
jgi:hypothetical protein